ncbi:toll/interleukin-1 receptor domain-containing protein [Butyrivibrio sp. X503]|uniref:toll/interleukin-1 receptor domain-containing protein n=1 Tax=Butyrivibrio sp. X503 TaxID=2364878 RepID=UPI000EA92F34|nr:toll/interleukin-1 receptor domain-containing protein [Butyrivibrio sp. X503]RKM55870.1 toll/interleukin-1 receptor domain-containing protein [Butyrivibrio sp. X503]
MSTHYNAFISYKHAELDNKIAAMVERGLEHYHIPHKIRKKTGMKKIERIFRDTDELPITSDLSGTIAEALENADYLIVICSTNTCKSMWVEREIKLFLKNHTQDQILTVLADGEPVDVVPEILKNKEVTRVNELGIEETVTIPVEPLSCDFRLPVREAKNTELPRLAAALIGCGYNELMDRQRQYKMKRLTAVFAVVMAVMLAFVGNLIYSNKKVNDSYRASLVSQSKYLANESEKLLDNQNRIDALHLALAALPGEEMPDRPVTTEALRAITQATMAYVSNDYNDITSIWNYEMPGRIEALNVDSDNKYLEAMDQFGNIKIWDTDSHKELYNYNPKNDKLVPTCFKFISDGRAIMLGDYFITCINVKNGKPDWEQAIDESCTDKAINLTKDGNILLALSDRSFRIYSQEDGKVIDEYKLPEEFKDSLDGWVRNTCLSPDNTKIAFSFTDKEQKTGIGVYDITSDKAISKMTDGEYTADILFPTNDELFLAYPEDPMNSNTRLSSFYICKTDRDMIYCLDPDDLSEKWTNELITNDVNYESDFIYIEANNSIAYYSGDTSDIWDVATGERLHHFTLNSAIVYAYISKDQSSPSYITLNGSMARSTSSDPEDKDTISSMEYFIDNLGKGTVGAGCLFLSQNNGKSITQYSYDSYDKEWKAYDASPKTDNIYYSYMDDNVAAVLLDEEESVILDLYDPNDKKYNKRVVLAEPGSEEKAYHFTCLGTYDGKLLLNYKNTVSGDELRVYFVDYKTGEYTSEKINKFSYSSNDIPIYENGKIVYIEMNGFENQFISVYDIATQKTDKYRLPIDEYIWIENLYYFEKQGFIYAPVTNKLNGSQDAKKPDYIIDINENEIYPVVYDDDWNDTVCVSMNDDGSLFAVTDEKNIIIKDIKNNDIASIPIHDVKMRRPVFVKEKDSEKDLLIVPFTDGNLCRYDAMTGNLVGMTEYTTNSTADYESTFTFDTEHSCIYFHYSTITNIFDMDSYIELGYLTSSMGYHKPTDTFPCLAKNENGEKSLGYFRHYNLDDLIKKAKDILKDHEMPQEQKDAYGIG